MYRYESHLPPLMLQGDCAAQVRPECSENLRKHRMQLARHRLRRTSGIKTLRCPVATVEKNVNKKSVMSALTPSWSFLSRDGSEPLEDSTCNSNKPTDQQEKSAFVINVALYSGAPISCGFVSFGRNQRPLCASTGHSRSARTEVQRIWTAHGRADLRRRIGPKGPSARVRARCHQSDSSTQSRRRIRRVVFVFVSSSPPMK